MNLLAVRLLATVLLAAPCLASAQQELPFRWPNGARAAVNLAYDDALDSQLDHVIPRSSDMGSEAAST